MKKLLGMVLIGALSVVVASRTASAQVLQNLQEKALDFGKQIVGEKSEDAAAMPTATARKTVSAEDLRAKEQELKEKEVDLKNRVVGETKPVPVSGASATGVTANETPETRTIQNVVQERHNVEEERIESAQRVAEKKQSEYDNRVAQDAVTVKTRLQGIQDEMKQQLAERIVDNLYAIQKRTLTRFTDTLGKLGVVLANSSTRTDKAVEAGVITKDTANEIYDAITAARNAIAGTRNAVLVAYNVVAAPSIPSGATIQDIQSALKDMRNAIQGNLTKLENEVKSDFKTVQDIAVRLSEMPQVNEADASSSDK